MLGLPRSPKNLNMKHLIKHDRKHQSGSAAGISGVADPRRCHHIACVAAPCICPPGARAKVDLSFCHRS